MCSRNVLFCPKFLLLLSEVLVKEEDKDFHSTELSPSICPPWENKKTLRQRSLFQKEFEIGGWKKERLPGRATLK